MNTVAPRAVTILARSAALALLGCLSPLMVFALLYEVTMRAWPAIEYGAGLDIISGFWHPEQDAFGLSGLLISTLICAVLSTAVCLAIGTPAAIRLAFFSSAFEHRINLSCLMLLSALPSVLVGLFCLYVVASTIGVSLVSGVAALTLMTWPTFVLLLYGALLQRGRRLIRAATALGVPARRAAYRLALNALGPDLTLALSFVFGKAVGEAMAVSFVIGNVVQPRTVPNIFEGGHTLTTMILKDHSIAAGDHLAMVYLAILFLCFVILVINAAGLYLADRLIRQTN